MDIEASVVRERGDDVCIAYTGHPIASGDPQLCFSRAALTPPG